MQVPTCCMLQVRATVTTSGPSSGAVAPRPLNVAMGLSGASLSLRALADLGVKRVSLGSSLARAAYGAILRAAQEIRDAGTFRFSEQGVAYAAVNVMFKRPMTDLLD